VLEDASGETSVRGLTYIEATSGAEAASVLAGGAMLRATAATEQNDVSSRSHTVFSVTVVNYGQDGGLDGALRLRNAYAPGAPYACTQCTVSRHTISFRHRWGSHREAQQPSAGAGAAPRGDGGGMVRRHAEARAAQQHARNPIC
jgi:hypothetical protein